MLKFKNLTILGTSHIAKESVQAVERLITQKKPNLIALELDLARYRAIVTQKKQYHKNLDIKTFIINLIGAYAEKSLGKQTGIKPGTEMRTAIDLAKQNKIPLFLIDQPINITLRKLSSQITRKEKITLVKDVFTTIFNKKKKIPFDLNKVPSKKIINSLIQETKEKYPSIYKILVEERNVYMAKALNKIINKFPEKEILAIVGAGHENDIVGELKSITK